jgi:predicted amidophosphoribosyltransferase
MPRQDEKNMLVNHNQSLMAWKRIHAYGASKCSGCDAETETWWNYCAMCGYHIVAHK